MSAATPAQKAAQKPIAAQRNIKLSARVDEGLRTSDPSRVDSTRS